MPMKAVIHKRILPPGRRILAVSDVHGNLAYLRGLLSQVRFSAKDVLVLCGDLMEKGPESLATLRYVMELSRGHTVWPLLGNCDGWHHLLYDNSLGLNINARKYIVHGAHSWGRGMLRQMCDEIGFPVSDDMDMELLKRQLRAHFAPEFDFLDSLPHVIETPNYTFVHGGLPPGPPETWQAHQCMKNDNFLRQGRRFDKWVIVGHWPVVLYGDDITCANPIIDRDSHIISIDGGCVLKDDGQLNALIIPRDGSEAFTWEAYDPFPVRRVLRPQAASKKSAYIRWGDNLVQVLRRGEEFSRVRHVRTGYELDILTKYLYGPGEIVRCNDCTDYVLPLEPGDRVHVVEETSRGYLVKHKGVSGWYYGPLA